MGHQIVDISANNQHPISWAAVKASGVEAVFIKATQGTGYTNPDYRADATAAKAAGLLVAGYHFADFTDAANEALHFVAMANGDARILDSEGNADEAWQESFLEALHLPGDEELDYGSASSLPHGVRSFLWPASWGKNPGFGDCWQLSATGSVPGISGDVDLSEWIGSEADWQAFWNLTPSPDPLPSPPGASSMQTVAEAERPTSVGGGVDILTIDADDHQLYWQGDAPDISHVGGKVLVDPQPIAPLSVSAQWRADGSAMDVEVLVPHAGLKSGDLYANAMVPANEWKFGAWVLIDSGVEF